MSRSERRHHEERVKAKWRRRVRRWNGLVGGMHAWKKPPPEDVVQAHAVRRAHHNKCPCDMCKKSDHHDRPPKPKERAARSVGSDRGKG